MWSYQSFTSSSPYNTRVTSSTPYQDTRARRWFHNWTYMVLNLFPSQPVEIHRQKLHKLGRDNWKHRMSSSLKLETTKFETGMTGSFRFAAAMEVVWTTTQRKLCACWHDRGCKAWPFDYTAWCLHTCVEGHWSVTKGMQWRCQRVASRLQACPAYMKQRFCSCQNHLWIREEQDPSSRGAHDQMGGFEKSRTSNASKWRWCSANGGWLCWQGGREERRQEGKGKDK